MGGPCDGVLIMAMMPGKTPLRGPVVNAAWTTRLNPTGDEDGWDSDYAKNRRLLNELARNMWFEDELMGGAYHSPGQMNAMFRLFRNSSDRKRATNMRRSKRNQRQS